MTNNNIISKSLVISILITLILLFGLITIFGYKVSYDLNLESLIKKILIYNKENKIIKSIEKFENKSLELDGGYRAEIVLSLPDSFKIKKNHSLFLNSIKNPLLITQKDKILLEFGDFKNNSHDTNQFTSLLISEIEKDNTFSIQIKKSEIFGSDFEFLSNSGITTNNHVSILKLARLALTTYFNIVFTIIFLVFFFVLTIIWLNSKIYLNFWALGFSFLCQGWVAFYFSRIWLNYLPTEIIHQISFCIYFLSFGFLTYSFNSFFNLKANKYLLKSFYSIFYFTSALLIALASLFYDFSHILNIYKIFLTTHLFLFPGFIALLFIKRNKAYLNENIVIYLSLIIVYFGQLVDILRALNLINFMYNIGPYTFFLASLVLIANVVNRLHQRYIYTLENEKYFAIIELASQVAHDIRSPLAALNSTITNLKDIPEQQRITLRAASNRINDIANTLLSRAKNQNNNVSNSDNVKINTVTPLIELPLQIELLPAILDTIISEKRVQFRDKMQIEIEGDFKNAYGAFAKVNPIELSRVISNLINNSVEAMTSSVGKFNLTVFKEENKIILIAKDNGKGIPQNILDQIGQKGLTFGKEETQSGSGLGLYHAKMTIEKFGGNFEIQSVINEGTKIIITLPSTITPRWFVEKIKLRSQQIIVSLDDDLSIHNIWKGIFQNLNIEKHNITHQTFTSGLDFKSWLNNQKQIANFNLSNVLFLIDYELLDQKQTGLDIIEELGISSQSILVTSRFEELEIRNRCEKLGVQLIPKGLTELVPIVIYPEVKKLDAILIDDDSLIGAKAKNKLFEWYNNPDEFYSIAEQYDLSIAIYIDVSLANNIKGQDVAIKLSKMGFLNLYLATGYEPESIDKPSIIKTVIGKECPL